MKKQTAVEWLIDQYKLVGMLTTAQVDKAKAMEKEQIIEAWNGGILPDTLEVEFERYYKETYNNEQ